MAIYDEFVEMDDIRRTGLVFDDVKKRDKQRLSSFTPADFESELAADDKIVDHVAHMIALEQGAKIYEKNDMDAMALRCFMRLRACGYKSKQTTNKLAELFEKLKNKSLARWLRELAENMPEAPDDNPMDALPLYGAKGNTATPATVIPMPSKSKYASKKPH
jgi:hypothetical protein